MLEQQNLKESLKQEKKDDTEQLEYARFRTKTENMYTFLDKIDDHVRAEQAKKRPCSCKLNYLH